MLRSIRARLILSSTLPSLLFLVIGVIMVLQLTRSVQLQEFTDTLEVELRQLIAWAQVNDDGAFEPKLPGATRFETTFSGWYYQVFKVLEDGSLEVVASSSSLRQSRLNIPQTESDSDRWFVSSVGPTGETVRIAVQRVRAETLADGRPIPNPDDQFLITVARSEAALAKSDQTLIRTLGVGVLVVASFVGLATLILITFGLSPLRRAGQSLHSIRSGEARRLEGDFPQEIEPLAEEINLLIDENEKVVERARTQVGNLAHALKTPLSVLTNEAGEGEGALARSVREQAVLMQA